MAVIVNEQSRTIIQGITGRIGRVFAERMALHYENFVGGVSPGKGGMAVSGKPVFDFVADAVEALAANTSIVVVPGPYVREAVLEAFDAGIKTVWVYTDGVPVHDTLLLVSYANAKGARLIGPNSAGIVSPGKASAGELNETTLPLRPGPIGVVSKSGSLSYEVINMVAEAGYGFSTVACVGGDPVIGSSCRDIMEAFANDDETKAVVLLGEIGGSDEIDCIEVISQMKKPVVAYIAGHTAPPQKKMGHAGAIVQGNEETAAAKTSLLQATGVKTADCIDEIPRLLADLQI